MCVEHTDVVDDVGGLVEVVGGSVVGGLGLGGPGLGGLGQISLLTLTHALFETSHPITGSQVFGEETDKYEHSLQ